MIVQPKEFLTMDSLNLQISLCKQSFMDSEGRSGDVIGENDRLGFLFLKSVCVLWERFKK